MAEDLVAKANAELSGLLGFPALEFEYEFPIKRDENLLPSYLAERAGKQSVDTEAIYEKRGDRNVIQFFSEPEEDTVDHEVMHAFHERYNPSLEIFRKEREILKAAWEEESKKLPEEEYRRARSAFEAKDWGKILRRKFAMELVAYSYNQLKEAGVPEIEAFLLTIPVPRETKLEDVAENYLRRPWKDYIRKMTDILLNEGEIEMEELDELGRFTRMRATNSHLLGQQLGRQLYLNENLCQSITIFMYDIDDEKYTLGVGIGYRNISDEQAEERLKSYFHADINELADSRVEDVRQTCNEVIDYLADKLEEHIEVGGWEKLVEGYSAVRGIVEELKAGNISPTAT